MNVPSGGNFISTTTYYGQIVPPVPMRIIPTVLEYSNIGAARIGLATYPFASLAIVASNSGPNAVVVTGDVSGSPTSGVWASIGAYNSSSAYLALSAEL